MASTVCAVSYISLLIHTTYPVERMEHQIRPHDGEAWQDNCYYEVCMSSTSLGQ
jgi:hypothetical protein